MTDREILDEVTLIVGNAREARNGTARSHGGEELFGFVIEHNDWLRLHCLLNIAPQANPPR